MYFCLRIFLPYWVGGGGGGGSTVILVGVNRASAYRPFFFLRCRLCICIYMCARGKSMLLLLLFLTFSALVANPKKTTLHGGQSRSWSAKQRKENKRKSLATYPPPHPPTLLVRRKKKKKNTRRIYRRYAGLGRSRVRTRIPTTRQLGQWVSLRKILRFRVR